MLNDRNLDTKIGAITAAALLSSTSKIINGWSMLCALSALLSMILGQADLFANIVLFASLVTGLAQAYFAIRCRFDAAIFDKLGGNEDNYASFDLWLSRWQLRKHSDHSPSIDTRVQGALKLQRQQVASFLIQIFLLVLGIGLTMATGN